MTAETRGSTAKSKATHIVQHLEKKIVHKLDKTKVHHKRKHQPTKQQANLPSPVWELATLIPTKKSISRDVDLSDIMLLHEGIKLMVVTALSTSLLRLTEQFDAFSVLPNAFLEGLRYGMNIIQSQYYASTLMKLLQTLHPMKKIGVKVIQEIIKGGFAVDLIRHSGDEDAYFCVRCVPGFFVRVIYMNSSLMLEMMIETDPAKLPLYTVFIGHKLAHQVAHIVHCIISGKQHQSQTICMPPLKLGQYTFDDIGDCMEAEVAGGVLGILEADHPNFQGTVKFKISQVLMYSHLNARMGHPVLVNADTFKMPTGGAMDHPFRLNTSPTPIHKACAELYHRKTHTQKSATLGGPTLPPPLATRPAGAVRY